MRTLSDRAVRVEIGIALRTAAKLAGVSHYTLALYESNPLAPGEQKRAACATFYEHLRAFLRRCPGFKEAA